MKVLHYKHVFGEEQKAKFEQIRPTTITCDSTMVKANGKNTAFIYSSGGGGVVCILDTNQPGKIPMEYPMLKGHQGQILDLDWNPFDDSYLATSSSDCTVKLWKIPEQITEDITEEATTLNGHDKKVNLISWHPSANWVIGSASHDQTVRLWDVQEGQEKFQTSINCLPYCLEWNYDGSLLGISGNDKAVKILDPRQQSIVSESQAHQGTKPQKFQWLGQDYFVSVGFNKQYQREYSLWNIKNSDQPISTTNIDNGSGIISPFYDDQLGMLYFAGKGDASIRYFEFIDGQLYYLNQYQGLKSGKSYGFFPKRTLNVNKCEIMRAIKLEEKEMSYISFIAPRKSTQFQEDLYPDCPGSEASMTAVEFFNGTNKGPKLISMRPENVEKQQQQQPKKQEQVVFQHKEGPKKEDPTTIIERQREEISAKDLEIQQLKEEIQLLKAQLKQYE